MKASKMILGFCDICNADPDGKLPKDQA